MDKVRADMAGASRAASAPVSPTLRRLDASATLDSALAPVVATWHSGRKLARALREPGIAKKMGVSLSRFARVFKTDMGTSLVDHRNQLRLERFLSLVDAGGSNLLEAAYAAGFGIYSQSHRVFRALRGRSPRDYFSSAH